MTPPIPAVVLRWNSTTGPELARVVPDDLSEPAVALGEVLLLGVAVALRVVTVRL